MRRDSAAGRAGGGNGSVRVEGLSKTYAGSASRAVANLSITVEAAQLYSLLGPSGCGKTTTMRCIAGLETPDEGDIWINDVLVFSSSQGVNVPSYRRGIGMVFQSYAIWPHMTVFENVAYPLKRLGLKRPDIQRDVNRTLELVGLVHLADRPAPLLSGGEQQRVALARALVGNPPVVLLDEPLSNLDAQLRQQTRSFLKSVQRELGLTAIYVTHDQDEAFSLSDVMAVMNAGRIEDLGPPEVVYSSPASSFSASFVGTSTQLDGLVVHASDNELLVETPIGIMSCRSRQSAAAGQRARVFLRPEEIEIVSDSGGDSTNETIATIEEVFYHGSSFHWMAKVGEVALLGVSRANSPSGDVVRSRSGATARLRFLQTSCVITSESGDDENPAENPCAGTENHVSG